MAGWFSPRMVSWVGKGFWAVTDQALFAGTNFLVNILLARWLEPAAYGAFATAYAVFLLLGTLHTALWTEPMLVYGSSRYREAFGAYQAVLLRYHWRFGLAAFAVFLALGLGLGGAGQRELALSLLGLSLAAPLVLYMWLMRRGAYALLEPRLAAVGGGLYLFLYLGLAVSLLRMGLLNPFTALLAMALAALVTAEVIRFRLKAGFDRNVDPSEIRAVHWGYGRWALLASVLSWVPGNFYVFALAGFSDLGDAGRFKVLSTLLMPVVYFNSSMMQVFLPLLSEVMAGDISMKRKKIVFFYLQLAIQGLWGAIWGWVLYLSENQLIAALVGGEYVFENRVFFMLFVSSLALSALTAFSTLLRAANLPNRLTVGWLISALLTVFLGFVLVPYGGLGGAVFSSALVNVISLFVMAILSREVLR